MKEKHELGYDQFTPKVFIHNSHEPNAQAKLAIELVVRWGMVAAMPDGEDSSGRSKLRLSTPEELADRACATASALMNKIESRGWLIDIPDIETIRDKEREARERN